MKHTAQTHRLATAALFTAALAPFNLVHAQTTGTDPIATERPVTLPPTSGPVVTTPSTTTPTTTTPSTSTTQPAPLPTATTTAPPPAAEAARPAATRQTATRRTTTTATRSATARAAPARAASSPAPAAAEAPAAPPAAEPVPPPAPAAQAPLPVPPPAEPTADRNMVWLIGAGLLALLALLGAVLLLRRRRARADAYDETYDEPVLAGEPVAAAEPAIEPMPASAFAPVAAIPLSDRSEAVSEPAIEPARMSVVEADPAEAELLAASSDPQPGRPWLEFFLRPVRAGTDEDSAVVEFALTVGNTGSEPARDVRVSTFMFPAGSAAESEMERRLIEPAPGAAELALGAGDAARVDGEARLPREALEGEVLPVVVADARYRLPDGGEGRMRAAFEIGRAQGEALAPFPIDRATGLTGEVAARLHGEVERV